MIKSQDSSPLYEDIRALVRSARQSAARCVDLLQVYTNYEIGRRIFEHEQKGADRAGYGKELLNELASRLTGEFGGGFRQRENYFRISLSPACGGDFRATPIRCRIALAPTADLPQRLIVAVELPEYGLNACQIRGHSSTSPCVQYVCNL